MSQNFETFGKYILLEKIAMGGMAEVYLARSVGVGGVGKFVAIKRILPQFSEQTEFVDMFKDEAKIAINLAHGNIVSLHEFGVQGEQFFIVMDLVEGRNLRQILNKMKKANVTFSIEQALYVVRETAAGIDHAHRCLDPNTGKPLNIIHRDMSPQNVMVSFEGEVKVVDFGIAKAETQIETTRAGTLKGKFGYMSPEQAEGQQIDLRTDVFSLGIVLWELLANDRLFLANNEVNTLRKIRDCQIPSLRKINPNIPPELERIVSKALAKDRNLRYQTADALQRELSRFLNRQYPDFSSQDFAVFVKTLFAQEILENRKKMVEYSKIEFRDQERTGSTTTAVSDKTVVTGTFTDSTNLPLGEEPSIPQRPLAPPPTRRPEPPPTEGKESKQLRPAQNDFVRPTSLDLQFERPMMRDQSSIRRGDSSFTGTPMGTGVYSRSGFQKKKSFDFSRLFNMAVTLMVFGGLAAAGAYYANDPARALDKLASMLEQTGYYRRPSVKSNTYNVTHQASVDTAAPKAVVKIVTVPAGADILINGEPFTNDVTPASISLAFGATATVTLRYPGYLDYTQTIEVGDKANHLINATLLSAASGYLTVKVEGSGAIFLGEKMIAAGSPVVDLPVTPDTDIVVKARDRQTGALDVTTVRLGRGEFRTVTLKPTAPTLRRIQGR